MSDQLNKMCMDEFNRNFLQLLDHPLIKKICLDDPCGLICDQYILAMTYLFFLRGDFKTYGEMEEMFLIALSLAHALVDENSYIEYVIWCYARPIISESRIERKKALVQFKMDRFKLLRRVNYDGCYQKDALDCVIKDNTHAFFSKSRNARHSGVLDMNRKCPVCGHPMTKVGSNRLLKQREKMKLKTSVTKAFRGPLIVFSFALVVLVVVRFNK